MASIQDVHSQLVSMQLELKSKKLSKFEKLPKELRRKIYEHLLKAENVQGPPDDELVCYYKFETSILAVSKQIHQDTWPILYQDNQFIIVSHNWDDIFTLLNEYEVAPIASTKPKEVAEFKNYVLDLHVNFPERVHTQAEGNDEATERDRKSFLLVATELPRFVRMLRVLKSEAGLGLRFEFDFQIRNDANGPPSLTMVKAVMEPFYLLGTLSQKALRIEGITDLDYANRAMDTISRKVKWLRGTAWECYELVVSCVKVAEKAYALEKWQKASITYREAIQVLHQGCYHNGELGNEIYALDDDDFFDTRDFAYPLMESNSMLIWIRAKEWDKILVQTAKLDSTDIPPMASLVWGRMYLYRGIALAATGKSQEAVQEIKKAYEAEPSDRIISDFATMVADHSNEAAIQAIFSDTSIAKFETLLPLQPAIMNPSEYTASERYVLHHFGYKGDYLTAIKDKIPLTTAEKVSLIKKAFVERKKLAAAKPGAPLRVRVLTGGVTLWE